MTTDAGCPSCGSDIATKFGARSGHTIYKCASCGLAFFSRPISLPADYQDYYPYLSEFDTQRFDWEVNIRRKKYMAQLALIRNLMPVANILVDIGAGPGYFIKVAKEEGFHAVGVEPSVEARNAGTEHLGVTYTQPADIADNSVDVVTCHHVLEHVEWPQHFLSVIHQKLNDGGLLVIHVPNLQPLSFFIRDLLQSSADDTHCSLYYPEHINGFTSASLVRTVENQKFKLIQIENASMWSVHYDPFFLANYYRNCSVLRASYKVVRHAARCTIDNLGNLFNRGDWLVAHFRVIKSSY
jgi:2-polyprenyl-3-methyl-5-hydroxy-6-metoxy-1,4-benzoquinol methylase